MPLKESFCRPAAGLKSVEAFGRSKCFFWLTNCHDGGIVVGRWALRGCTSGCSGGARRFLCGCFLCRFLSWRSSCVGGTRARRCDQPLSPPAAERRPEAGEDDPFHLIAMRKHYRWHRYVVVNFSLDEVLGLESPALERLEIRRLQTILQAGDELTHQRLKAYLGDSGVWLAPPDLPGKAYFLFEAWEVVYYDRAAHCCRRVTLVSLISRLHGPPFPRRVPLFGRVM